MTDLANARPAAVFRVGQVQLILFVVAALTAARFALASIIPLAFDEAYYWRWSTNLATGYFDHPPLVAWLIRLGTSIAGQNEFGVRLVPLALSVPASWAVWRSAVILFGDRSLAMTALVFFNLTLMVSIGTILATPDASLVVASAFLLLCLAKVAQTGHRRWWLAAGLVTGIGCLAKFTALFWLPSILLWLLLTPRVRPWLATPWPWIGAMVSLLVYFPNLVWNANHEWATFGKQFSRVSADEFAPQFLAEHFGSQLGMATPIIFVLGWLGLAAFMTRRGGSANARVLVSAMIWPTTLYFLFHALHAQVEGNWTGPIFPAFALAAAAAVHTVNWHGSVARFVAQVRPWAVPLGLVIVIVIYAQTLFGWLPLGISWDPTASRVGSGIADVANELEAIRQAEGASLILTADYPTTAWISYYIPAAATTVRQINEPERWLQESPPTRDELRGPLIAIVPAGEVIDVFGIEDGTATPIARLQRRRGERIISEYEIYRVPAGTEIGRSK